jgi:hypothetical protein
MSEPLIAGRDFQFADEGRPPVAIVNQAMARHYFADGNPLGRHVLFDGDSQPHEIVGVVADAKYADVRSPAPQMKSGSVWPCARRDAMCHAWC